MSNLGHPDHYKIVKDERWNTKDHWIVCSSGPFERKYGYGWTIRGATSTRRSARDAIVALKIRDEVVWSIPLPKGVNALRCMALRGRSAR